MSKILFTADLHFGHANIIRYCNRPWLRDGDLDKDGEWISREIAAARAQEMDEALTDNWNSVVNSGDKVYVVGDFAFKDIEKYASRLDGRIFLIPGNHDTKALKKLESKYRLFDSKKNDPKAKITILPYIHRLKTEPNIILCHYAMHAWEKSHYGSWHLFGHSHGALKGIGKSMDIGVDCHDYHPVSFEYVSHCMDFRNNDNWVSRLPGYSKKEYERYRGRE